MWLLLTSLLLFVPLQSVNAKAYPCSYAETVNLTDGLRLRDGSYSYGGLLVPANLTAEYDFKVIDGVEYTTAGHIRGCACRLKPCITFCCPEKMMYDEQHHNCTPYAHSQHAQQAHVELTYANGSVGVADIRGKFLVRYEFGCQNKLVDRQSDKFWKWDLFENGSVFREGYLLSVDEYCFTPLEHKKVWRLIPLSCERFQRGFRAWIYVISTVLAILINVCIVLFLISIKEVRHNNQGELIICYLISLIVGLALLVYVTLKNPWKLSHAACRHLGFYAYFFIILSFLFLNIISWDYWCIYRHKSVRSWKRKLLYVAPIMLAMGLKIIATFAEDSGLAHKYKPGIGGGFCWFDVRLWGKLIYYYLPIVLSLGLSVFCCFKAYFARVHLPSDTLNVDGYKVQMVKTHFNAFMCYLLLLLCVWMREMIVYIGAHLREHYFIIDPWCGVFILALAISGFVCFAYRNTLVQSWWNKNVLHKTDDYNFQVPLNTLSPQASVQPSFAKMRREDDAEN